MSEKHHPAPGPDGHLELALVELASLSLRHEPNPQTFEGKAPPVWLDHDSSESVTTTHSEPREYTEPERHHDPVSHASVSSKKVKLADRRGLLAFLSLIPEYYDAREYPNNIKYFLVFVVSSAAVTGPMGTSIMLPAIEDIVQDLDTTPAIVNISVGIYLLALGIFPLWWLAFLERHGRRSIYIILFALFLGFLVGNALLPNIAALIVLRFLVALSGASAVQSIGAGTIGDLFITEERGTAMGLFYLGPLLGPFLSPIIGGAVSQAWGWRATQYTMLIFCAVNLVLIVFFLPETLQRSEPTEDDASIASADPLTPVLSRLSSRTSQVTRTRSARSAHTLWSSALYDYFIRPTHSIILLTYPPVALIISYSSICFACVYFFNMTITYEYERDPYNFSSIIIGLMYIPNSVTYIFASVIGGRWNDRLLAKYAALHGGALVPESRISWNVVTAILLYPPACLIFGWCFDFGTHWVTPLIGTALFGFASMLVIGSTVTYLVDILPGKGATGVALNNLVRQILAATATFIVEPLLRAIGPGILFTILMGIMTVASVALWYLKKRGTQFRERYDLSEYYARL